MLFTLKKSRFRWYYQHGITLVAAMLCLTLTPLTLKGLALCWIILVYINDTEKSPWCTLTAVNKQEWVLENSEGVILRAKIQASSLLFIGFLRLDFHTISAEQKKSIVLFQDQLSDQDYRHLRRLVKQSVI